jgi:hypothetical protein
MDFSNIQILSKGVTRKSTAGISREANFDVRYTSYTKETKNGTEKVRHFVFTKKAMQKTGLESPELAASPFYDGQNGVAGIVVLGAEQGEFFTTSKRSPNGRKSKVVTVPNLANALAQTGALNLEFEGSQHFDLNRIGETNGMVIFSLTKSTTVEDKPYVKDEVEEEETSW